MVFSTGLESDADEKKSSSEGERMILYYISFMNTCLCLCERNGRLRLPFITCTYAWTHADWPVKVSRPLDIDTQG
jgi:hypothetical protein